MNIEKSILNKKICIIAGANSEIGVEIAKHLQSEYYLILVWHKRNNNVLEYYNDIKSGMLVQANLCKENEVENLIKNTYECFGHLDLIINCIGENIKVKDEEIDEACWDTVLGTNLKPALFLGRYYSKFRIGNQSGCIINFSSTAGIRGIPVSPHYIVAKAGIIALSEYYAKILAPYIRVNVVAPGYVETIKHKSSKYNEIRRRIPMKRMAMLSEIADTILYLSSCEYITGQTIVVDGGLIL